MILSGTQERLGGRRRVLDFVVARRNSAHCDPSDGDNPCLQMKDEGPLAEAGETFTGPGGFRVKRSEEDDDQQQSDWCRDSDEGAAVPTPFRLLKEPSSDHGESEDGRQGQKEAERVHVDLLESEYSDQHRTESVKTERNKCGPPSSRIDLPEIAADTDRASERGQSVEHEGNVHGRTGLTQTEPADRLANGRIALHDNVEEAVSIANESEQNPCEREGHRSRYQQLCEGGRR